MSKKAEGHTDFRIGDKVIDVRHGEGEVVADPTQTSNIHPVTAIFNDDIVGTYTENGFSVAHHTCPSLFHLEGYQPPSSKQPVRYRAGQVIWVRDHEEDWKCAQFVMSYPNGVECEEGYVWSQHKPLTPEDIV